MTIAPDPTSIEVEHTIRLTATSSDASDDGFNWSSADTAIAAVDPVGNVTGVALGTVDVTATGRRSGLSGSARVYVVPAAVTISPKTSSAEAGQRVRLKATSSLHDDAHLRFAWSTTDPAVATVASDSVADAVVTTIAEGSVEITAIAGHSGRTGKATVNVIRTFADSWERTFGNGLAYSLLAAPGGGYLMAGLGSVRKLDAGGHPEWSREVPEDCYCAAASHGGGYVIGGTVSDAFVRDAYLLKLDTAGNELWSRTYDVRPPDSASSTDGFQDICATPDGGYILVGQRVEYYVSYAFALKVDGTGNEQWTRQLQQSNRNAFESPDSWPSVTVAPNGDYLVAAPFGPRPDIIRLDPAGNEVWRKPYTDHHTNGHYDQCHDIVTVPEGGYAVAGGSPDGAMYLAKLDEEGEIQWWHTYLPTQPYSEANDLALTPDGGYILVGHVYVTLPGETRVDGQDLCLLKVDALGNEQWSQTFGASGYYHETGYSVVQAPDGGYVAGGALSVNYTRSELYLVKMAPLDE